ncbi:M64 family metallopeptidase [Marinimicrobium sp. ABcell2]|uniref:M64 family metallopeptidase n=1 Tax=Marinimicrobium sp. ABcell2 TaxID=3069751 RepID=UPI0027B4AD8F|nr:M64 family metallopeptidase [Marinimicrobium sp. ABcell2]MDQ2077620.1 M64 family metallopeptidase [Marinimicrobium sp. ABcell2]
MRQVLKIRSYRCLVVRAVEVLTSGRPQHKQAARCALFLPLIVSLFLITACDGGSDDSPEAHLVTSSASDGGSITPSTRTVSEGRTTRFTVAPSEGYTLDSVTGCGGRLDGNTYVTEPIHQGCTVSAHFEQLVTITKAVQRDGHTEFTSFELEPGETFTVPVEDLTWYSSTLESDCQGQLDEAGYVISSATQPCTISLSYHLDYLPADAQPAVGFTRAFYDVGSGESITIDIFGHSFTSTKLIYEVEQIEGPEIEFVQSENELVLHAPIVDESTIATFRVSLSDEHNLQISRHFDLIVYPTYSDQVSVLQGTSNGVGVDLMITGDGFTGDQQDKLVENAARIMDKFFEEPTIAVHKDFWNVHLAPAISAESGAVDGSEGHSTLDTAFGSYFNCGGTERSLCTDLSAVIGFAGKTVPQFDQILIMVNDLKYGGAGYWGIGISTFSLNQWAFDVAIHEMGHSFALLADEYAYGECLNEVEFEQANVTIETNPEKVKWKHWYADTNNIPTSFYGVSNDVVGYFRGGNYCEHGVWRPTNNSLMRTMGMPFGPVNAEQWALSVYRDAGVIRGDFPMLRELAIQPTRSRVFAVEPFAGSEVQKVRWFFNDEELSESLSNGHVLFVPPQEEDFSIRAVIEDVTGLIRSDPEQLSSTSVEWQVTVTELGE